MRLQVETRCGPRQNGAQLGFILPGAYHTARPARLCASAQLRSCQPCREHLYMIAATRGDTQQAPPAPVESLTLRTVLCSPPQALPWVPALPVHACACAWCR